MPLGLLAAASLAAALPAAAPFDRTCGTRIEVPGPVRIVPGRDLVMGRAVFWALGGGRLRHLGPRRAGEDRESKLAVSVRAGGPVTVRITPLGAASVSLDYDRGQWHRRHRRVARGQGYGAIRFHACPRGTIGFSDGKPLGEWTSYNGGFLVHREGCARLTVSARSEPAVARRVAVGVPVARCR